MATGAGRPPGGFLRLSLSAAQADQQRRSGAAPASPRAAHTHRLASLSRVSREPVLAWGPLQKAKEGSFISFRDTHTFRTLCHPRGQELTFHFQGDNSKVTATSTARSPGLGTAPSNPYIQPEGHCCLPQGEAKQPPEAQPQEALGPGPCGAEVELLPNPRAHTRPNRQQLLRQGAFPSQRKYTVLCCELSCAPPQHHQEKQAEVLTP